MCSKIFTNQDFGYLKLVVERPLRLNFQVSVERIARLDSQTAFINLAVSKKIKDEKQIAEEEQIGITQQQAIKAVLTKIDANTVWKDRKSFLKVLDSQLKKLTFKLSAPVKKAILEALSERDPDAEICLDSKGDPEADPQLRDTELVSLPLGISLPLPLGYDNESGLDKLLKLVRPHCEAYMQTEVLPHVPDAWVDYRKTKVGYEIPINRHFYVYEPPRPLADIKADIEKLEQDIMQLLGELSA